MTALSLRRAGWLAVPLALALGLALALALDEGAAPAHAQAGGASGFTLSTQQLRINQRISQAAVRRSNRANARLDALGAPAGTAAGAPGAQGRAGAQGPPGPAGPAGRSVNSFQFGDTYCHTLADTPSFGCYEFDSPSSNANNRAQGWSYAEAQTAGTTTTLTLHGTRNFLSCFEWRVNGSLPTRPGANPNTDLKDGRWDFACVSANGTATHRVTLRDVALLEVRLAFGAESSERFNWEVLSG